MGGLVDSAANTLVLVEEFPAPQLAELDLPAGSRIAVLGEREEKTFDGVSQILLCCQEPSLAFPLAELAKDGAHAAFLAVSPPAEFDNVWVLSWMRMLRSLGASAYEGAAGMWLFQIGGQAAPSVISRWVADALAAPGRALQTGTGQEVEEKYLGLLKYVRTHRQEASPSPVAKIPEGQGQDREQLLKKLKDVQNQKDRLAARYKSLAESKLGSLTLKWWARGGNK